MYKVSDEYKRLIDEDGRVTGIVGTLTLKNGSEIVFDNDDIAKAPEINGQCSGDQELVLGQAYQSQLKLSLYSNTDRYSMYGATIKLKFQLLLDDDSVEEVPLGKFIVSECIRTANNILNITALDEINKLDKTYKDESVSGTAYDVLKAVHRLTRVELGQTEEELYKLPNATAIFGLPPNPKINTLRDLVGDLAAVLGGFAYMDRDGKLRIKSFSKTIEKTISADYRKKESISDYKIRYTKVSCIKGGKYFSVGNDSGQELSLGENVFLQLGLDDTTFVFLQNLLAVFKDMTFTPSNFEFIGDPAIDYGDLLEITGFGAKDSTLVPVHKTTWKWRGNQKVEAVGKNPYLNTASKDSRKTQAEINQLKSIENGLLEMNNPKEVVINDYWADLASTAFATTSDQTLGFNAVCKLNMVRAGTVKFRYLINGVEFDFMHEAQVPSGVHTVSLFIPVYAKKDQQNTFKVQISSDAVGSVDFLDFRGALSGSGLIGDSWDGTIIIDDVIGSIVNSAAVFVNYTDTSDARLVDFVRTDADETAEPIINAYPVVDEFEERVRIISDADIFERILEDGTPRLTEEGIRRQTCGGYEK